MKTLHRYLTGQTLGTLALTVAMFTFVLLLGNVLKEILSLLVSRQASFLVLLQSIGLLIPYVLVFALPMGLLTAALLVFGRFSADHELTAVRAGGVSLIALITPVLFLSFVLSLVCATINLQFAPQSRVAYKRLLFRMGVEKLHSFVPERTFIKDFPGYIAYFGKVTGTNLQDVIIYELGEDARAQTTYHAARGRLVVNRAEKRITALLEDGWIVSPHEGERSAGTFGKAAVDFQLSQKLEKDPGLGDYTFLQLLDKKRELEKAGIDTMPVEVQMHSQLAFSFACIGFTLVGIPLGIRAHRRETSAGIAMALLLVLGYYSFFILGQSLESKPQFHPQLIVWLPNFIFQAVGIFLIWRANRRG